MRGRLVGSLRAKFLVYLSAGGIAVAAVGSWITYRTTIDVLHRQLVDHGYMLVSALSHAAMVADDDVKLNHVISEVYRDSREIDQIVIVLDKPPRIGAASDPKLDGLALDQLPDQPLRRELAEVLQSGRFGYHSNDAGTAIVFVAPLLPLVADRTADAGRADPERKEAGDAGAGAAHPPHSTPHSNRAAKGPPTWMSRADHRGAIALVLSRAGTHEVINDILVRLLGTIAAAILATMAVAYCLLRLQVLRPLAAISRTIALQGGSRRDVPMCGRAEDAIGAVAAGLGRLLDDIGEGERRLHDLADSTADWFWEMDENLRFTYCATRSDERLDDTRHTVIGKTPWELVGADPERDPLWQMHKADLEARRAFRDFRYGVQDPNGTVSRLRVSGKPFYDRTGRFRGFRGTAADETEKVAAQQRAERAEAYLREAIEAISEGFVLFDADDRFVLCNGKYREFYAESHEVLVPGRRFEEIIRYCIAHGEYPEAVGREEEFIRNRVKAHQEQTGPSEQRLANGRWLLVQDRRTRDGGIAGIRTDITALKQREAELRLAKEAAETASWAKSEFLSNMSHELRTPLNAIIGFSEVIKDAIYGPPGHPNYAQYAGDIYRSGRHLLDIINDILDLSKIEAGKTRLVEVEVDVPALVHGTVRILDERARSAGLELTIELVAGLPLLCADERAVRQILLNLLSNAIKFTAPGGRITVRAEVESSGELVLAVVDTGIGMSADELPRALEPFGQIESSLTRRHQGTGLGLPLAKKLTEAHGGSFVVESELGIGTAVSMRFPAARVLNVAPPRGAIA